MNGCQGAGKVKTYEVVSSSGRDDNLDVLSNQEAYAQTYVGRLQLLRAAHASFILPYLKTHSIVEWVLEHKTSGRM